MRRLDTRDSHFADSFAALLADQRELSQDVTDIVAGIIADVRARGDAALAEYTKRFDRFDYAAHPMRVTREEIAAARAAVSNEAIEALSFARDRIAAFHERQRPADARYVDEAGATLGWRWTPLSSVGLYVPGGLAAYPSSVLMNAVPAKVAGVERIVITVPAPDAVLAPIVLAAADLAGVTEIYRVGGAQAIAALAYGTETIAPVDKIVGPGNAFVASAKRQVFGAVGIDLVAGPSEVVVVADHTANPEHIAADLLAQAEHDEAAQSILITNDPMLAEDVANAVERQLVELPRRDVATASWREHGAIIRVGELDEAVDLVDRLAPEHLELAIADPDALAERITHAGAIFLGTQTPEAIGDYVAGTNHVLPTSRSARFSSGLSLLDFMKRTTLLGVGTEGLKALADHAMQLASTEGLDAHRLSILRRLEG
ncbi:histidinol dehydrogenase [Acuticoccus sp. M5D2P5]|uniref:histidinol dehydrogenase n=1 Tax=Acuticoccus kalidii TaxID=2910977 RepID=UPI001F377AB2|nr:histidinol dehydrogenase [Acuticoccus kalidii]MCF3933940.1 histidinol dehydrogenase [Acuticoccus kalidii]